MDVEKIAERVDKTVTAALVVDDQVGGIAFTNMSEMMEFAKLMSTSGAAVPKYMRANPGACLAICTRALRWKMDPFFVAEKSYMVNNKGEERVAFESQLIHAVIEARAPIKSRLRHEIVGAGDERRCKVWATFRGEDRPHEYISETLGKIVSDIGRNDFGKLKGSPLWETKPELQLFYSASRDWARQFAPDVLAGVYTIDELPDAEPVDVSPQAQAVSGLSQRLKDRKAALATSEKDVRRGFDADHVAREAAATQGGSSIIEGEANPGDAAKAETTNGEKETGAAGGHDDGLRNDSGSADSVGDVQADDTGTGQGGGGAANEADRPAAGGAEPEQSEIFPGDRKPKPDKKR
jgi:hypothetical protein